MPVLEELMMDDNLSAYPNDIAVSYEEYKIGECACYKEMCHGNWWRDAETYIRRESEGDSCILPIILHIDGTLLDATGKHSADPVSISLGNFSINIRVRCLYPVCNRSFYF